MQHLLKIGFFLTIVSLSYAQPIRNNSFGQKMEAAATAEDQANYAGALDWYEQAYDDMQKTGRSSRGGGKKVDKAAREEAKMRKMELSYKIAELSYEIRDYEKAEKGFRKIIKGDKENIFTGAIYWHGMALKALGEYDIAIKAFNRYISLSDQEERIQDAENELAGIALMEEIAPNIETSFRALDKEINSASGEFSPRQNVADGNLYFGSMNRKKIIKVAEEDDHHAQIFMANVGADGKVGKKEALGDMINRKGFHNSNVAFTEDGRTMFFTRVQTEGTDITSSQILVSYKKDSGWSAADIVEGLNGDWHAKQPALGRLYGKNVIFFASDMPGGSGGMDIYYANMLGEGNFSTPVNLGKGINTAKEDIAPFYHDGSLYYSTEGKPTIGGFDIYFTNWDGADWSEATNLGLGFNSSYDDLYFSMNTDGKSGYVVSNRIHEGKKKLKSKTCCDDIFVFNVEELVIDLLALVVDGEDPLSGATIKLKNLTDAVANPAEEKSNTLGNEFQFLLGADYKYKAVVTAEGYYPDSIEFNTAGILDNFTINKTINLRPIPKKPDPVVTETKEIVSTGEAIRLDNIYYDFDDTKILLDAEEDLNVLYDLLIKYPDMVIELSSHTDAQGRTAYNEDLSQRRAESATRWLLNKGIKKKRIKPVGYGESIILNHCKNGVKCSDDEHRQNRRTEFKILSGPTTIEIIRKIPLSGN